MCRLTALFRLSGTVILSEVLATPLSAYVMTFDPLIPYVLGLVMIIVGSLPALVLPETLNDAKERLSQSSAAVDEDDGPGPDPLVKQTLVQTVVRQVRKFIESTRCIWQNTSVMLALFAFFVTTISRQSTNLLIQYASLKFHWSIARVSDGSRTMSLTDLMLMICSVQPSRLASRRCHARTVLRRDALLVLRIGQILPLGCHVEGPATVRG